VNTRVTIWLVVVMGAFTVAVLAEFAPLTASVLGVLVLCCVCELVDSSLGMGFGTSLTPILLLAGFDPHDLVPSILISEFLSGFASFYFHTEARNVDLRRGSHHLRTALTLAVFSVIGVALGVAVAVSISKTALTRVIGVIILAVGVLLLATLRVTFAYRVWKIVILGLVASFNKAVSGGGYGPLMTGGQLLSGVDGRAAVGITSFAEGFTCLTGAILFLLLGESVDLAVLIPVVTGSLVSVPFAAQIVRRVGATRMKLVIAVLTTVLGAVTLFRAR
jgi:uncharacterized membrane protein YfcA